MFEMPARTFPQQVIFLMSEHGHDWQPEVCQGEEGEGHHQQHHCRRHLQDQHLHHHCERNNIHDHHRDFTINQSSIITSSITVAAT